MTSVILVLHIRVIPVPIQKDNTEVMSARAHSQQFSATAGKEV